MTALKQLKSSLLWKHLLLLEIGDKIVFAPFRLRFCNRCTFHLRKLILSRGISSAHDQTSVNLFIHYSLVSVNENWVSYYLFLLPVQITFFMFSLRPI